VSDHRYQSCGFSAPTRILLRCRKILRRRRRLEDPKIASFFRLCLNYRGLAVGCRRAVDPSPAARRSPRSSPAVARALTERLEIRKCSKISSGLYNRQLLTLDATSINSSPGKDKSFLACGYVSHPRCALLCLPV
jgi:hypothetical protein